MWSRLSRKLLRCFPRKIAEIFFVVAIFSSSLLSVVSCSMKSLLILLQNLRSRLADTDFLLLSAQWETLRSACFYKACFSWITAVELDLSFVLQVM